VFATPDEVRHDHDIVIEEYRQANVPGFRPGRAPLAVIANRYQKEIADTAGKRAATRLLRKALEERDIVRAGPARFPAIEFDLGTGLTFTAEFDVTPEIELPDFKGFSARQGAEDDSARKDDLSEFLLANTSFALPESLVDQELELAERDGEQPGITEEERRDAAKRRVKLLLVLRQIAKADGIEVDDQDVENRIAAMAEATGTSARDLRTEIEQKNGLERLRLFLLAEQTMDYILGNTS